jgi:hypothetical protein
MKLFKILGVTLAAALFVAGCGGNNSLTGVPGGGGGGGGATVAKVTVTSSAAAIAADGSTTSTITAVVVDANNVAVPSVAVSFAATAGGVLQAVSATTDVSGNATATLKAAAGVAAGTTITVTASAGSVSGSTAVSVIAIQQTISLTTDLPQIPSDASKSATISALLRDANNNALPGVTVQFSSTSGVLTVTQATTDQNGIAKATLNAGSDPTNRTITVNAGAGTAASSLPISVTGTSLTLSGPANLVQNSSGSFAVVLTSSSGQGIPQQTVTLSSANGNTLSAVTLTTDASGRGTFTVTGTVGGQDTISAAALGLVKTATVAVSTQNFQITAPADNTVVGLGASQTVTVTWLNNGQPVVKQPVSFATTRGALVPTTPVNTDANGQASISISSSSAGPAIVAATAAGVSAQITLDFVALTPSQIAVQAGPASVAVQGQSTITALVRDASNNLVQGAQVDFTVVADPTNGGLSVPSATTDAQGRAQTVYTAGSTSGGANGVQIKATVTGTSISATTLLTVGGQTVFLSLGTGNTIDTSQGVAIYQITYTVFAVDSHGAALSNQPITVSILPVAYGKGVLAGCPGGTYWGPAYSTTGADPDAYMGKTFCQNEDTDYTGNINSLGVVGGVPVKDYNNNGKLDPGNVAVVSPSSGATDANGRLDVKVTYPRDHSYWVVVALKASTTTNGTESSATSTFVLQGAQPDYSCSVGPPGPTSPYGTAKTCADPN